MFERVCSQERSLADLHPEYLSFGNGTRFARATLLARGSESRILVDGFTESLSNSCPQGHKIYALAFCFVSFFR